MQPEYIFEPVDVQQWTNVALEIWHASGFLTLINFAAW